MNAHQVSATVLTVLLLGAAAGCGTGDGDPVVAPSTGAVATAPAPTPTGGTPAATPFAVAADAPVGATLLALVGTADSPEAFEISLTTESGTPVRTLAAGTYTIRVTDRSKIHNFALRGERIERATDVRGTESPTWTVDLTAGDYTYTCDPHPTMSGSFLVT